MADPLESYMMHQGRKFLDRFDANSYVRIVDMWQRFDLLAEAGASSMDALFSRCRQQTYLIFSIDSDVCFYPHQQEEMARALKDAEVDNMRITVHSRGARFVSSRARTLHAALISYAKQLNGRVDQSISGRGGLPQCPRDRSR